MRDIEYWKKLGFEFDSRYVGEYDLWFNLKTMQRLRRCVDGQEMLTDSVTGKYKLVLDTDVWKRMTPEEYARDYLSLPPHRIEAKYAVKGEPKSVEVSVFLLSDVQNQPNQPIVNEEQEAIFAVSTVMTSNATDEFNITNILVTTWARPREEAIGMAHSDAINKCPNHQIFCTTCMKVENEKA